MNGIECNGDGDGEDESNVSNILYINRKATVHFQIFIHTN